MRKEPDYYSILGVDPSVTAEELRARRNRLVRELHPDRHAGDPVYLERITEINVAFHELRDEFRRRSYDRRRREASARPSTPTSQHMTHYANTAAVRSVRPSMRTEFHTARRQVPQRVTHKRQALIGAIFAAVAAIVVILAFLVFGDIQFQTPTLPARTASVTPITIPTETYTGGPSQQNLSIEQAYQRRLSDVIADAQVTVEATSTTASILEDEGKMDKAALLRRETTQLEMKLLNAGDAVRQLGNAKTPDDTQALENELDIRIEKLAKFNGTLNKEQQSLRDNGTTSTATDPKGIDQPSQLDNGLQNTTSTQ